MANLFSREVVSGSTHPNVISIRLPEVDIAASEEDLSHSGFVFDKNPTVFEFLDSKSAKGMIKMTPAALILQNKPGAGACDELDRLISGRVGKKLEVVPSNSGRHIIGSRKRLG